jgi:uridylate kinase
MVTFSLGSTISNKDGTIDVKAISSIAEQFKGLLSYSSRIQIIAVVGAGELGRNYTEFARHQIRKRFDLDSISIRASRVNALLLASVVRNSSLLTNAKIPETMVELNSYVSSGFQAVILGGLEPGMTYDSTAATIAQMNRGPLVIVSTFGGIFRGSGSEKGQTAILPKVDRPYLRRVISLKEKEDVLDVQTCRILLSKKSKGMTALVTSYANIMNATRDLLSTKRKETSIKGSTRILI